MLQRKWPRVSLPDKFDGTHYKFRGFVNQIGLITTLQPERSPMKEAHVGLVGTLLTWQILSWFVNLFEKRSSILNSFQSSMETFVEAFGEHDKLWWATTKIRPLGQGARSALVYASYFRQLTSDINWAEKGFVSQFYWGLNDDVKDLMFTFPDLQTFNESISQAVKYENCLVQRRQDRRPRQQTTHYDATMISRSFGPHWET